MKTYGRNVIFEGFVFGIHFEARPHSARSHFKMSKVKKLSLEQKRNLMLEFFHEKKDVFLLKDLEKFVPKAKGLPMQTVKEVLTSLLGDDLVDTDKIGTSTYYWAFPSKALNMLNRKIEQQKETILGLEAKNKELDAVIEEYANQSSQTEEEIQTRATVLEQIASLEKQQVEFEESLVRLKDLDPASLSDLKEEIKTSREAIERWTDNIFSIKNWVKDKFFMSDGEIAQSLNIPEDFDYYEEDK